MSYTGNTDCTYKGKTRRSNNGARIMWHIKTVTINMVMLEYFTV